jgi:hypothetical protein
VDAGEDKYETSGEERQCDRHVRTLFEEDVEFNARRSRMLITRIYSSGSDDFQEQEDEDDEQDGRDAAAAVVADAGTHAVAAKTEDKNKNNEKDEHTKPPFNEFELRPDEGCWLDADCGQEAKANAERWVSDGVYGCGWEW